MSTGFWPRVQMAQSPALLDGEGPWRHPIALAAIQRALRTSF